MFDDEANYGGLPASMDWVKLPMVLLKEKTFTVKDINVVKTTVLS